MDAKKYLQENPLCDVIHSTSDGNLFYVQCHAVNHAKTLEDKTVVTERQKPKTESDKPVVVATNKKVDKKTAEAEKAAEAAKADEAANATGENATPAADEAANATGENATPAADVTADATNTNVPAIAAVNKPTAAAKKGATKKASTK